MLGNNCFQGTILLFMSNAISKLIETVLASKKMSGAELARRSGVDQAQISRMQSGALTPTVDTIVKLAKGLNIPPAEVFHAAAGIAIDNESTRKTRRGVWTHRGQTSTLR